jgi:glycerol uptake facilitator protein
LAPGYIVAQMMGACVGAVLVFVFYRDHYTVSTDPDAKLATFATSPAIRNLPRNLFGEAIGTFVLVFAVLMAVEPSITWASLTETGDSRLGETQQSEVDAAAAPASAKVGLGTLGALPVGLLVLAIGLSLGGTTGYAINPARDLGPRIAHALLPVPAKRDSDWSYAWVPVLGPLIGAVLAFLLNLICYADMSV